MSAISEEGQRYVERELAAHRDRFTEEEERLFRAGRHRELAKVLTDRAQGRYGMTLGLLISLEFVPIAYVVFALLVFDLGPWEIVIGFLALFVLFGLLPARMLRNNHRLRQSATRAWAVAHEAEVGRIPDDVDLIELVDHMDPAHRPLLEQGRLRELADRLKEDGTRGIRFSRVFRTVPLVALIGVVVLGTAFALDDGRDALFMAPLALAFVAILYAVIRSGKESAAKARAGDRLRESLPVEQ